MTTNQIFSHRFHFEEISNGDHIFRNTRVEQVYPVIWVRRLRLDEDIGAVFNVPQHAENEGGRDLVVLSQELRVELPTLIPLLKPLSRLFLNCDQLCLMIIKVDDLLSEYLLFSHELIEDLLLFPLSTLVVIRSPIEIELFDASILFMLSCIDEPLEKVRMICQALYILLRLCQR